MSTEGRSGCPGGRGSSPEEPLVPAHSHVLHGAGSDTVLLPGSVWYWGSCAVYDSGGYVQELGPSLEESRAQLGFLQLHNWIDNRWAPCPQPLPNPAHCAHRSHLRAGSLLRPASLLLIIP